VYVFAGANLLLPTAIHHPRKKDGTILVLLPPAMIEEATGIKAFNVGKPKSVMMRSARKALVWKTAETTFIGDTHGHDIRVWCRWVTKLFWC